MGEVRLKWAEKNLFVGVDSTKHAIVISAQDEENAEGMKPSDLLLLALGSCSAVDVVGILKKKRQKMRGLSIHIEGDNEEDPPWQLTDIRLLYKIQGEDIDPKAVEQAIELAEMKYCSVAATLRSNVRITSDFEIIPQAGMLINEKGIEE